MPPLGNEFNNMLKTTSLLFVLGVQELYNTFVDQAAGNNFLPFEMYLACALWYLLLTTIWGVIQGWHRAAAGPRYPGQRVERGPGLRTAALRLPEPGAGRRGRERRSTR